MTKAEAFAKLAELSQLPAGWGDKDSLPTSDVVRQRAIKIIQDFPDAIDFIGPLKCGGVQISLSFVAREIELFIEGDSPISYLKVDSSSNAIESGMLEEPSGIENVLAWLRQGSVEATAS